MYIESVPNRNSPPCVLLRESYREDGKVKKRTLANLSNIPPHLVAGLQAMISGRGVVVDVDDVFEIISSLPHGHVEAVLGTARKLGLGRLLDSRGGRKRDLVMAMIAARVIEPRSKFATAQGMNSETQTSSLGLMMGVPDADDDDLYGAMDWLLERQERIENALAARHLENGSLVLYDVTSTYFEGETCSLARRGYSRDGKGDKLQIVFGLLCNSEGCPVAVEVFEGDTGDPSTLASQIEKLRARFHLERVVLVGDRGMITEKRLKEDVRGVEGLDWITALRAPQIRILVEQGALQLSLFDTTDLCAITSPDYPGERLIVCHNPPLARKRRAKREELLAATEKELEKIAAAVRRVKKPLRGKAEIGLRAGKIIDGHKVGKHFVLEIEDDRFVFSRDEKNIEREAALDGIYVVRTSVPATVMSDEQTVGAYKSLSTVERAFRSLKTVDLKVRPIYHHLPDRVRAHVFLCMLAYYVEWHIRRSLAPLLFDDHDRETARQSRESVVAPARVSPAAAKKARTKRTENGDPVESFQQLLDNLGTIALNLVQPGLPGIAPFYKITRPTPLQQKALDLLGVTPRVPSAATLDS
jgi:hypothetical protein